MDANNASGQNATYNTIGLVLAISSGFFIGASFIIKKKGLLKATSKSGAEAGQGHAYLKSPLWWIGMIMMVFGELFNFAAYAFTAAVIVTPLGALSVVISAILSSFLLKERLNSQGKIGCGLCIVGAIVIVLHAPAESAVKNIPAFMKLVIQPAFLVYCGLVLVSSLFLIFYSMPRVGRTNMLVPLGVCSIVGSVAVVFTQGFGAAIVYSVTTENQFTHWFTYVTLVIMLVGQVIEINYLNIALNCFNTAMVTPVYYVTFTTSTIVASAVLNQGFHASGRDIATVVLGFLVIVSGVALLHLSKGSEDATEVLVPPISELVSSIKAADELVADDVDEKAANASDTLSATASLPHRRRTTVGRASTHDLERQRSLLLDFEAGPWAMRSNPLQALFLRPVQIAEELVHERRVLSQIFDEEAAVHRRHTVSGRMELATTGIGEEHSGAASSTRTVPKSGAGQKAQRLGGDAGGRSLWHRVQTMYGDPRSEDVEVEARDVVEPVRSPPGARPGARLPTHASDAESSRTMVVPDSRASSEPQNAKAGKE